MSGPDITSQWHHYKWNICTSGPNDVISHPSDSNMSVMFLWVPLTSHILEKANISMASLQMAIMSCPSDVIMNVMSEWVSLTLHPSNANMSRASVSVALMSCPSDAITSMSSVWVPLTSHPSDVTECQVCASGPDIKPQWWACYLDECPWHHILLVAECCICANGPDVKCQWCYYECGACMSGPEVSRDRRELLGSRMVVCCISFCCSSPKKKVYYCRMKTTYSTYFLRAV